MNYAEDMMGTAADTAGTAAATLVEQRTRRSHNTVQHNHNSHGRCLPGDSLALPSVGGVREQAEAPPAPTKGTKRQTRQREGNKGVATSAIGGRLNPDQTCR